MFNKKAQGLSITTIILIILGVVVLVVLIIGFTKGWGSVKGFFGGGSKAPQVESLCNIACTTEDIEAWCIQEREGGTCDDLAAQGKFVDCVALRTKCPTKKCADEGGIICDASVNKMCNQTAQGVNQYIKGPFSDVTAGEVCCKVACVTRPSE